MRHIDGDGRMDLASASWNDDKIAWYRNVNGDGSSWTTTVVTTSADGARSVFAADIDGDGRMDLASASWIDDKIAWYRNVNGDGSSWTTTVVTTSADGATPSLPRILMAMDAWISRVLLLNDNKIAWYRNVNGDGSSWTTTVVTTSADGARSVFAADIDGDGRMDLASASYGDDKIAWYRNVNGDGSSWTTTVVTTSADGARSVFAADIDGDGRMDLASASFLTTRLHGIAM